MEALVNGELRRPGDGRGSRVLARIRLPAGATSVLRSARVGSASPRPGARAWPRLVLGRTTAGSIQSCDRGRVRPRFRDLPRSRIRARGFANCGKRRGERRFAPTGGGRVMPRARPGTSARLPSPLPNLLVVTHMGDAIPRTSYLPRMGDAIPRSRDSSAYALRIPRLPVRIPSDQGIRRDERRDPIEVLALDLSVDL